MREHRVTCDLGPVAVDLCTDQPSVIDYLNEFYPLSDRGGRSPAWLVDARVGPTGAMRRNPWGVAYAADPETRQMVVRAEDAGNLAITTRKAIREVLVGFCEDRRYAMLHASAVARDDLVAVFVGDKGSGKTTLALRAVLQHSFHYLSNDHLIIYADPPSGEPSDPADRLVLTSLPTPLPVKIGTYLDLEHVLPHPWDGEGLDIEAYRLMPRGERYRHDGRVLYTLRRLGQERPATVALGRREQGPPVVVALTGYAANGDCRQPEEVPEPAAALLRDIRLDWPFDPVLNQRHIPRQQRDEATYSADARRLVEALSRRATVVAWVHAGDPGPLLDSVWRQP